MKVTLFLVTVANWFPFTVYEGNKIHECLITAVHLAHRFEVHPVCVAQQKNQIKLFEVKKVIRMDGFDEAIAGICRKAGHEDCILYDEDKVLKILMEDGMSEEDAIKHYEYSVIQAFVEGEPPAFFFKTTEDELDLLESLELNSDGTSANEGD